MEPGDSAQGYEKEESKPREMMRSRGAVHTNTCASPQAKLLQPSAESEGRLLASLRYRTDEPWAGIHLRVERGLECMSEGLVRDPQ
jgi:hypothetical protein